MLKSNHTKKEKTNMKKKERIIFETYRFNTLSREEQVQEYLQVINDPIYGLAEVKTAEEVTDEDLYDFFADEQQITYDAERENLDVTIDTDILAIADLGLWNGRRRGYRELGKNLNSIFSVWDSCEDIKLYVEGSEVKGEGIHHDGRNCTIFRAWKKNVSDEKKEKVLNAIYNNSLDADDLIKKATRSIAKDIKSIYGW